MTDEQKQPERGITRIGVDGFKSLRGAKIEIRLLTILAGANSSGKSAIMQPLLLMKQTLESPYDAGPLLLSGENVKFTAASQFFPTFKVQHVSNDPKLQVELTVNGLTVRISFGRMPNIDGISLIANEYPYFMGKSIRINNEMSAEEIKTLLRGLPAEEKGVAEFDWQIHRKGPFLNFVHGDTGFRGSYNFSQHFQKILLDLIHVPGLRGSPERNYPAFISNSFVFPGRFDRNVATLLNSWRDTSSPYLEELQRYLHDLGLTSGISVRRLNATEIEILVGRTRDSDQADMVSIADVGFGVSQVLPVLVALLAAQPGQLVYIEQPELHLHPRAQHTLATFIAEAAMRGVRVVIETHSDILLLGVQTLVAKGQLAPESVILHWFERDADGLTKITTREMDADGAYGDWPEDFADVDLKAQGEYLDTVAEKHLGARENVETPGG